MATIGAFTANAGGSASGSVRALAVSGETLRFRPCEKVGERGSDFQVHAGQTDLGVTWKATGQGDDVALSVKADDVSFGEPVNAALVVIDGEHSLVWSRSAPKADRRSRGAPSGASRPSRNPSRRHAPALPMRSPRKPQPSATFEIDARPGCDQPFSGRGLPAAGPIKQRRDAARG